MERWAGHLLPPADMGPEFDPVTAEVGARLKMFKDGRTFEVGQDVTTTYRKVAGPQAGRQDEVSQHFVSQYR